MMVKHRAGKLTFPQPPEKWIPSRRAYFQINDLPLDELLNYRAGNPSSAVKKVVSLISNDLRQISAVFLHYILHRF